VSTQSDGFSVPDFSTAVGEDQEPPKNGEEAVVDCLSNRRQKISAALPADTGDTKNGIGMKRKRPKSQHDHRQEAEDSDQQAEANKFLHFEEVFKIKKIKITQKYLHFEEVFQIKIQKMPSF
jgi:hypothetical protein